MEKITTFETVNPNSAGIDIGATKIFVSVDGNQVKEFETYTASYHECIKFLKEQKVERVAMEATGVYWMALYEMIEANGIEVCLVNPKEVKQVKGRKTDVKDARWIQKLFSAGLLRQSYVPSGKLKEVRMMMREREDIIEMEGAYINKMQKALELMNIKLTNVISQIHGVSGIKMIEAILDGERDPEKLLALCDKRIIRNKREAVKKALQGNYNESWLFLLQQNYKMYKQHTQHLIVIDKRIEKLLNELNLGRPTVSSKEKEKPIRHHKPVVRDLHQKLLTFYGVNASTISGLSNYTLLKLVGEVGNDLHRFPTAKHFVSWCQLSPRNNQSGNFNRKVKIKTKSKAGQIFKECAHSLLPSKDTAIGAFMRKIRSKKGAPIAVKAGARKIAIAFYNILTKGEVYIEQGVKKYETKMKAREIKLLALLANKHNFKLVDYQPI